MVRARPIKFHTTCLWWAMTSTKINSIKWTQKRMTIEMKININVGRGWKLFITPSSCWPTVWAKELDNSVFKVSIFRFDTSTLRDETSWLQLLSIRWSVRPTMSHWSRYYTVKALTYFGNSDSTTDSIISRSGLESFVCTNHILTNWLSLKARESGNYESPCTYAQLLYHPESSNQTQREFLLQ